LTIMEIKARPDGGHGLQSQSHREECWLEGWVAVPPELVEAAWACGGYCELALNETGELVSITPTQRPEPPAPQPTTEEQIEAALLAGLEE